MKTFQFIIYEERAGVARLTYNRPEARNARSMQMGRELLEALSCIEESQEARALILTGAGTAFSAGRDLKETAAHTPEQGREYMRTGREYVQRLSDLPIPTIAAINGYAFGGGVEAALACDIRLAAEEAVICFPECALGVFPGSQGTVRLPRLISPGHAMELIFASKRIDGREAERIGLVQRACPRERLLEEAETLAARIAENGPLGVRAAKKVIRTALNSPFDPAVEYSNFLREPLNETQDFREAVAAFREKRKPKFIGA